MIEPSNKINISDFWRFVNQKFCLEFWAQGLKDVRKQPQILSSTIFLSMILMGTLGTGSFLGIDGILRRKSAGMILRSKRRMVASDTTLSRVLPEVETKGLYEIMKACTTVVREEGLLKVELPQRGKVSIGVVDGSGFGNELASVFQCLGAVNMPLDLEPIKKKGKELEASYTVMKRIGKTYGTNFVDYVGGDGLYMTHKFFQTCREELGCHGFVKTDEETLVLVQDVNRIFDSDELLPGVECIEGVDVERMCTYKIWAVGGLEWENSPYHFKVARIEKTFLKGKDAGKIERDFVITTDESLKALDLWELKHRRWGIENNGFKMMNAQCQTKHRFFHHNQNGTMRLMLILFVCYILLQAYLIWIKRHKDEWGLNNLPRSLSLIWLTHIFFETLGIIGWLDSG